MRKRTVVAITASVGIAAMAATGVNYASASNSTPRSAPLSGPESVPSVQQDAAPAVPFGGGDDGGIGGVGGVGGNAGVGGNGRPDFDDRNDHGRIHVNERTYSPDPGVCIAVVSGLSTTFNVRNETHKTVEFFRGITCDNGAPTADVGPRSTANGIPGTRVATLFGPPFGIVGSFRVIDEDRRHR